MRREVYVLVEFRGHWMEKTGRRGRSLIAYETARGRDMAVEKEFGDWMEESSRFVEQHVGKSGWISCNVKER
jgi:hypothetical protein